MFLDEFHHLYISLPWVLLAVAVFIVLFFVTAPYGRYTRRKPGPSINNGLAWLLMEAPAPLVFIASYLVGSPSLTTTQLVFLGMWESHYLDRAFLYPFAARVSRKPFPVILILTGFIFNLTNAYLNSSYLLTHTHTYQMAWLWDGRFILGSALFAIGFIINRHADYVLRDIRHSFAGDYAIPQRGLYRWVSCPNYLGEIILWFGWALATWSPAAAAFAFWTVANLAPRAYAHHKWYHEHFKEYPQRRRALVPGIW